MGQVGPGHWSKIILLCSGSQKGHNLVAETTLETLAFGYSRDWMELLGVIQPNLVDTSVDQVWT